MAFVIELCHTVWIPRPTCSHYPQGRRERGEEGGEGFNSLGDGEEEVFYPLPALRVASVPCINMSNLKKYSYNNGKRQITSSRSVENKAGKKGMTKKGTIFAILM